MHWLQVTVFKRALTEPQKEAEYNSEKRIRIHDSTDIPASGDESEETQVLQHINVFVQTACKINN